MVIEKLTREKYAGMHADTDNEVNNFWQKLSYGFLERHRRYDEVHRREAVKLVVHQVAVTRHHVKMFRFNH